MQGGNKSAHNAYYYQCCSEPSDSQIGAGLQCLRFSLSGLKVFQKLLFVVLTALLVGSLAFRYLSRSGDQPSITSVNVILALLWYIVGQVIM